jgi:hypothetical protein
MAPQGGAGAPEWARWARNGLHGERILHDGDDCSPTPQRGQARTLCRSPKKLAPSRG